MENTQKKKLKDMNRYQIRKYKSEKERERWRNLNVEIKEKMNIQKKDSKALKLSTMTDEEKIWYRWCEKQNKKKSRHSQTKEKAQFQRIVDRQRKRNGKKESTSEKGNMSKKDLLEWLCFFQEREENRVLLKMEHSELYNICQSHLAGKDIILRMLRRQSLHLTRHHILT